MQYGYIRVSTKEQNDDRQRIALSQIGLTVKQLYIDKQSEKISIGREIFCYWPQANSKKGNAYGCQVLWQP